MIAAAQKTSRRVVSHTRELLADTLTPVALYGRLEPISPWRFLFESVTGGEQVSRYSFLGTAPTEILRLYPDRLELEDLRGGASETSVLTRERPLQALRQRIESYRSPRGSLPFNGGHVGFFGWDLVRELERLPSPPPDPFGLPLVLLARFDTVVVFDHARQRVVLVANEVAGEVSAREAEERLESIAALFGEKLEPGAQPMPDLSPAAAATGDPSLSDEDYRRVVRRAKEYIAAGDIFQVVPARRWEVLDDDGAPLRLPPLSLYRALRIINPSPYMVLYESPELAIVGGSPEMLVRVDNGRVQLRPIAGTRPRGADPSEDRRLAEEMLADPKERAEHVMLVDLGRNDLGRVARAGGVQVADFLEVEQYSHVMHIVSRVEAELRPGASALDALLAAFPAGTLSGAPKIRAMEIIDELEPEGRGLYGGAVGYLSFSGDLDTCISIRTLLVEPHRTSVTAGAGIVADSDPETEQRETRAKAAALLQAVSLASYWESRP